MMVLSSESGVISTRRTGFVKAVRVEDKSLAQSNRRDFIELGVASGATIAVACAISVRNKAIGVGADICATNE